MNAQQARIERLMEAWRVLLTLRDNAKLWNRSREIAALGTAMAIVDACIAVEEGAFGDQPDVMLVVARLREFAAIRDIFAAERPAPAEAEAGPAA
jgi:hypothetical protein